MGITGYKGANAKFIFAFSEHDQDKAIDGLVEIYKIYSIVHKF